MILVEDRLILHDLKGVNLRVNFFLGTREEYLQQAKCIAYSVCYESVDVKVYQVTLTEQISELDFYYTSQQLIIDDHTISGEVINFDFRHEDSGLIASCAVLLGKDY